MIQHHTMLAEDVIATDIRLPLIFISVPLSPIVLGNFHSESNSWTRWLRSSATKIYPLFSFTAMLHGLWNTPCPFPRDLNGRRPFFWCGLICKPRGQVVSGFSQRSTTTSCAALAVFGVCCAVLSPSFEFLHGLRNTSCPCPSAWFKWSETFVLM